MGSDALIVPMATIAVFIIKEFFIVDFGIALLIEVIKIKYLHK